MLQSFSSFPAGVSDGLSLCSEWRIQSPPGRKVGCLSFTLWEPHSTSHAFKWSNPDWRGRAQQCSRAWTSSLITKKKKWGVRGPRSEPWVLILGALRLKLSTPPPLQLLWRLNEIISRCFHTELSWIWILEARDWVTVRYKTPQVMQGWEPVS